MKYQILVREIRRIEREVQLSAESRQIAKLLAEDPDNWFTVTPLEQDVEASELLGVDVIRVVETPEDEDA